MRSVLRRTMVLVSAVAIGAGLAMVGVPGSAQARTTHANLLVPLYDDLNLPNWNRACSQANGSGDGSWIIVDPAKGDGPGEAPDPAYAKVIKNCYRYGRASVIGYVSTNYGRVDIARVEEQIDRYYSFYPGDIAGIFLDEVSDAIPGTTTSNQTYYQTLASYVHKRSDNNDEVVFNFGANPGSDWMLRASSAKNADIVVTFEGSYDEPTTNPFTAWEQAPWEQRYPAGDFAALVYNAPHSASTPQPTSACTRLKQRHVGYVYVGLWFTDLAPYYSQLAATC
jgi:hypothetical protein